MKFAPKNKNLVLFLFLNFILLLFFIPVNASEMRDNSPPENQENITLPADTQNGQDNNNNINPSGKYIALTFDDGPHPGTTDQLLDGLRQRNIRATFFLIGEEAADNRELVAQIKADGHQIGNHTWSHAGLNTLSDSEILREIGDTDALLQSLVGPGEYWLRPPYGFLRPDSENLIKTPVITWSVDPRDWESRDADKIFQAVTQSIKPGDIVLLHDIYAPSVDAALRIIDALSQQNYEFVTVSELLSLYQIQPQAGVKYRGAFVES